MDEHPQSCPTSGSPRATFSLATDEACVCLDCKQLYVPDTRPDPEAQMCNDCAFRPGSPERQDEWKWAQIIQATIVDRDHPFFCHKGLACQLDADTGTLTYQRPGPEDRQPTPCAGWKAHLKAYQAGTPARRL